MSGCYAFQPEDLARLAEVALHQFVQNLLARDPARPQCAYWGGDVNERFHPSHEPEPGSGYGFGAGNDLGYGLAP
ncbi:hypothetical protein [Nocardiopsis xinjiangensis]|uniref:hypothetical protein n=1 Tax=Nocardiopsis xinjiangensis TaxID=124285 RepID=UPI000344CA0C|nr:hypothetical protein [Nocardiopsis xinjiangensis]